MLYFSAHAYEVLIGARNPMLCPIHVFRPDNDYPASWIPEYPYFLPREQGFVCSSQGGILLLMPVCYPVLHPVS